MAAFVAVVPPPAVLNSLTLLLRQAVSLASLDASFNCLTGSIPDSVMNSEGLELYSSLLDLRFTFMSCCSIGPLIHDGDYKNARSEEEVQTILILPMFSNALKFGQERRWRRDVVPSCDLVPQI